MKKSTITRFFAIFTVCACSITAVFQVNAASINALRAAGQQVGRVSRVYFAPSRPTFSAGARAYSGVPGVGGRFSSLGAVSAADVREIWPGLPKMPDVGSRVKQLPQDAREAWQTVRASFAPQPQAGQGYDRVALKELTRLYSEQIVKDQKVLSDMYRTQDGLRGALLHAEQALKDAQQGASLGRRVFPGAITKDLVAKVKHAQQAYAEHSQKLTAQAERIQALKDKRYSLQQR